MPNRRMCQYRRHCPISAKFYKIFITNYLVGVMNDVILMIEFSKFTLFNFYFIALGKKKDSCLHIVECANIAEIVWQKNCDNFFDENLSGKSTKVIFSLKKVNFKISYSELCFSRNIVRNAEFDCNLLKE